MKQRQCAVCGAAFTVTTHRGLPQVCSPACKRRRRVEQVTAWREAHKGLCPPGKHGFTGYNTFGCRCDVCVHGFMRYRRRLRRLDAEVAQLIARHAS